MKLSARNQFKGTVTKVKEGAVNGVVTVSVGKNTVKSDITNEAIKDLKLKKDKKVVVIIKASNVLIAKAKEPLKSISARNQFVGTVKKVKKGAVNGIVTLKIANDQFIKASITNAAIDDLGLKAGTSAVALVKATDVLLGVKK